MKSLYKVYSDCCAICFSLDIPIADCIHVEVNSRAKKRWGLCTKNRDGSYTIQISERLLADDISEEATFNTMLHELLHTCNNCMNHGAEWKHWADIINRKYPQYNIKRTTSCEEKGVESTESLAKYIITCNECGRTWHYMRNCGVVKRVKKCKCPYCLDYTLSVTTNF